VPNRIRELRLARGDVLVEMAARADIAPSTLIAAEKHQYLPSEKVRRKIVRAFGVSVDQVLPCVEAVVA
jgi:DNA-binding XRE family transcriptional regulator